MHPQMGHAGVCCDYVFRVPSEDCVAALGSRQCNV